MNSYGCLDTSRNTVNILPIPQVDFSYFKQDTCVLPSNYLFTNFAETIKLQIDYKTSQNLSRDPICSRIIECPVKIPDTDIYMDRYIISRCLMEKEENPFNRTKLTLNDIKIKF